MRATTPCSTLLSVRSLLALALGGALAACGDDSSDGSSFTISTTSQAASPSAPVVVSGDWIVYFASEGFSGAAGTDLNGDGDLLDQVAHAVSTRARTETNLMVAAVGAVVVGNEIYLKVDEALDNEDWSGANGATEDVLLHWSSTAGVVSFVDVLDASATELPVVVVDHVYYAAEVGALGTDETNLRVLAMAAPTTPVTVLNTAAAGALSLHLLREIDGLVFCRIDETDDATDRNGDGDAADQHVLALLDGTDTAGRVKNVELAMAGESEPLAARVLAANDWLVAFLVDEAAEGENLNDQTDFTQPLLPENCIGTPDIDENDRVLHWLEVADFLAGTAPPVSTGLAGKLRVLVLDGFVATISDEADANCNLNSFWGDADTADDVVRWVATVEPVAPHVDREDLHALATDIAGGSSGLAVLDNRLVAVVDEAADDENHDGKLPNHDLVAWLDPDGVGAGDDWTFEHQHPSTGSWGTGVFDEDGDSEPFAGTSWMAPEQVGDRLAVTFLEEVPGTNTDVGSLNTNLDCAFVAKDSDKTDGLPVWADFESGPTLDFDGVGFAIDEANAGIEIFQGFAFFRVSESEDNRDYNDDSDKNDVVVFRNPLTTCGPVPMATSSLIAGQVITTDGQFSAAFLSSEQQAGLDFNEDGDTTDIVVRWFRL